MTRVEGVVIGFLRHSSSPVLTLGAALLFCVVGVGSAWLVVADEWDRHLLAERGVVVEATVVAVPGLLEVTWPAIAPRTVFLETEAGDAAESFAAGDVASVVSDPQHPLRARLVGATPDHRGSAALAAGTLFLSSGYLKWWRWLVHARGQERPGSPGRHRKLTDH